ncbi:MAG TPA: disulfide bond formation protein B [Alphaproteobacteria bacterium]|jgi:disulfide bond formation protein DsbB|nr:disulfide bond formation protein B [Alphaproteobacteria bacterium]
MMPFVHITPERAAAAVLAVSVAILGSALLSQYAGGLDPCILCLYQRVPYVATISLSALALMAATALPDLRTRALTQGVLIACSLAFATGAGIALFHVGVEQGWWKGTESCSALSGIGLTLEELREKLLSTPRVVRCDEVQWSLFGISMAGYNFLASLVLAGASLWLARELGRRAQQNS